MVRQNEASRESRGQREIIEDPNSSVVDEANKPETVAESDVEERLGLWSQLVGKDEAGKAPGRRENQPHSEHSREHP